MGGGTNAPWMILRLGWYLGLSFCLSTISAARLSRMPLAMAVPSSLVAVIAGDAAEEKGDAGADGEPATGTETATLTGAEGRAGDGASRGPAEGGWWRDREELRRVEMEMRE